MTSTLIKTPYWNRARGYAFVRTRVEDSQLGVAIGCWGMAIEGCMHVVVCFVFLPPSFCIGNWLLLHRDPIIA